MKKIISICSLIVIAALVVTLFTACGGEFIPVRALLYIRRRFAWNAL